MKRLLVVICSVFLLVSASSAIQAERHENTALKYFSWCRHNALHWGSMVGEQYKVRMVIGYMDGNPHVQPQVYMGDHWWYFTMKPVANSNYWEIVFIDMKDYCKKWSVMYYQSLLEFAVMQNTWMVQRDGKTYADGERQKFWSVRMNHLMDSIKKIEEERESIEWEN